MFLEGCLPLGFVTVAGTLERRHVPGKRAWGRARKHSKLRKSLSVAHGSISLRLEIVHEAL